MFYSQFFTSSSPHVDRCSNLLPSDPLSSPVNLVRRASTGVPGVDAARGPGSSKQSRAPVVGLSARRGWLIRLSFLETSPLRLASAAMMSPHEPPSSTTNGDRDSDGTSASLTRPGVSAASLLRTGGWRKLRSAQRAYDDRALCRNIGFLLQKELTPCRQMPLLAYFREASKVFAVS